MRNGMKTAGQANSRLFPNSLDKKARLLELAGDRTRIRILCLMFARKKICVGDISKRLGVSMTCVSHHLQIMRDNGFFATERNGTSICYTFKKHKFVDDLCRIILGRNKRSGIKVKQ